MSILSALKDFKGLLLGGLVADVAAHCLDIISTCAVLAFVAGTREGNPTMVDPFTGLFDPVRSATIKFLYATLVLTPLSILLYKCSSLKSVASIPFWLDAYRIMGVSFANFIVLLYA